MNVGATRSEYPRAIRLILCGGAAACALTVLPCQGFAQAVDFNAPLPVQEEPGLPVQPMVPPTTVQEAEAMRATLYPDDPNPAIEETPANSEGTPTRRFKLTLQGGAGATYDSNIFISSRHPRADLLFTLSPGVKVGWGDWQARQENFLMFDYTLSGLLFVVHPSQDTIEQQAALDAQWRLGRLTLAPQFRFQDLSSGNVDVGNRTRQRLFETALINKFEVSDKFYLEGDLYNNVHDFETELSSVEWIGRLWLNYRSSPKLTLGLGTSLGHLAVENSPGQTFEQVLVRAIYPATEKLSFEAYAGVETRQLKQEDRVFPILNGTGTYRPFEATEIRLNAYRKMANSALLAGENYIVTGVSVEASHRFHAVCDLALAGGYNYSDYSAASRRDISSREDSYFFVRPSVRFEAAQHIHLEVYAIRQENRSTYERTSFRDTQVGTRVHFDY